MKWLVAVTVVLTAIVLFDYHLLPAMAIGIWAWFAAELFLNMGKVLAFREFLLTLYGVNYLLSPALTYHMPSDAGIYRMRIPEQDYFELAIPAMIALRLGLFAIKTSIFSFNYNLVKLQAIINQQVLKNWLIAGIVLTIASPFLPGELGFFVYLLSLIRYVAAFGLFAIDRKKYRWWLVAVLFLELSRSFAQGMFHDLVMWLIFFGIWWAFLNKPSAAKKIGLALLAVFAYMVLQTSKGAYRQQLSTTGQQGSFETFQKIAVGNISTYGDLFATENVAGSISRINQAWILASTVQNMDYTKEFQGLHLVGLYLEAALLPRFLAPNKLTSGNKEIFNRFSGHTINKGTSMGLGVPADGYIAYGYWGTLLFCFALGLIFGLTFKVVESWAKISPFFVLFIFPILNYAVRPDCETQTILGHIVKSLMLFSLLAGLYKYQFNDGFFKKSEQLKTA